MFPRMTKNNAADSRRCHAETAGGFLVVHPICTTTAYIAHFLLGQFGVSVCRSAFTKLNAQYVSCVTHLFLPRHVFQIVGAIVFFVAIFMINFAFGGARSDEGFCYEPVDIEATRLSVSAQHGGLVSAPVRTCTENAPSACISISLFHTLDSTVTGHCVPTLVSCDVFPLFGHKYSQLGNSLCFDSAVVNLFFERCP